MNFEEMKQLEPGLAELEKKVIVLNEKAKKEEIVWHEVWADIKPTFQTLVGARAQNSKLQDHTCYDDALIHLDSLATNMQ